MGQGNPGWKSSCPSIVGHFLGTPLWSHTTGIAGEFAGLDHWESVYDGEGGESFNNQHSDLADPVPAYNAPTVVLTSTFAIRRTTTGVQSDWEIDQGPQFCLTWDLKQRTLPALTLCLPTPQPP